MTSQPTDMPAPPQTVKRGVGLFGRLALLILAVTLPPLAGLGALMVGINHQALQRDADQLHLALAADARRAVLAELEATETELIGIGQLLLAPGFGDDEARLGLVGTKVTAARRFDFVTIYGPDGKRRGTLKAKEVAEPTTPAELPVALRGSTEVPLATGQLIASTSGPVLEVTRAILVGADVKAYVLTHLSLADLCKLVGDLGEVRLRSRQSVFVVSDARKLVLHGDFETRALGQSLIDQGIFLALAGNASFRQELSVASEFDDDGTPMLGALETIPKLGWAIVIQQPQSQAYASLTRIKWAVGLAFGLAIIAALGVGLLGAQRLTLPLRALVEATRQLGARRFKRVAPAVTQRRDELGGLGRAFDQMASELASSEEKLVNETRARDALARYLPADIVEIVVKDPTQLKLGGERQEVTVLFADVCGFTKLSETLPPETIVALLNELFTFGTEIVHKQGGIVDKFIGDCIMAVWGVPHSHPDDAHRAVQAAEDLRRWVETGNRRWRQKWGIEIQLAMGLHSGPVIAGNVGSERRMEYTVIGDTVNIAARLESMAQPGQILISASTREQLATTDFGLNSLGEKPIRGRNATTHVFEVTQ